VSADERQLSAASLSLVRFTPARCGIRSTLLALLLAVAVFATACGSDGFPETYDATVEENYMAGCTEALDAEIAGAATAVCTCAYTRIQTEVAFDDFEALNKRLRDDLTILQNPEGDTTANASVEIVRDCILSAG